MSQPPTAADAIIRELAELRGEIGKLEVKIDLVVGQQATTIADHETRIRVMESWQQRTRGQVALLAAGVALAVTLLVKVITPSSDSRPAAPPAPTASP